jgi:2-polyprenyl-3-methyl-5-hydroxy-6-metoxy-1,4-benzoquinol methylase
MLNKSDVDYFNSGDLENKKFWKRLGGKPNLENKSVLDFGCGHGSLCIDIARSGAKKVKGIDITENILKFADINLNENFTELKDKVTFKKFDILKDVTEEKFDIIVSKDTFEHSLKLDKILIKFFNILNDGGKAYIGFGPLYNFYNGDHGRTKMMLPWFHLIFSEKFIINRINKKRDIKIEKIQDLGLSKYSLKEYEDFLRQSSLKLKFYKTNLSDHPFSKIFNLLSKIKLLREFCTYNIYCILEK